MRKAQGALEYLIIIAAVLAIAAIVVLFLTGAFTGVGADISKCRLTTATCNNNLANGVYSAKSSCYDACRSSCMLPSGKDVLNTSITVDATTCPSRTTTGAWGCTYCTEGNATLIRK